VSIITGLVGSKIAASLLAGALVIGGGAGAAAYANVLPTPLQETAHDLIGAPAPEIAATESESDETEADETASDESVSDETESESEETASDENESDDSSTKASRVGPDVRGHAAYGLCQAYAHGGLGVSSTPYASFVVAADGEANIAAYCAEVTKPGKSAAHRSDKADSDDADTDDADEADDSEDSDVKNAAKHSAKKAAQTAKKAAKAAEKDDRQSRVKTKSDKSHKSSSKD